MHQHRLTHQLLLTMFVFNTVLLQYDILINTGAYRVMGVVPGMPGAWQFHCACLPNPVRLAIAGITLVRTLSAVRYNQSIPQLSDYSVSDPSVTPPERATTPERIHDVRKSGPSGDAQATPQLGAAPQAIPEAPAQG